MTEVGHWLQRARRLGPPHRVLGAMIVALALVACGNGSVSSSSSKSTVPAGGTITQRLLGDWQIMDPQLSPENQGTQLSMATYDRLLAFGPGQKLIPYVARTWKATATSATFTVRNDVTCADGSKLTPTAIANSFKRLIDPATNSPNLSQYFGNGPYSVSANDSAGTVSFTFGTPYSPLIYAFAQPATGIICPSGLANPASLKTKPAGSGPFTLESAVHGDKVVFKARPEWKWGPNGTTTSSPGFPSELVYQIVVNNTTAANEITTGGLDAGLINGPDIPRLQADKSLTQVTNHSFGTFTLLFNQAPGHVTTDEAVREAVMNVVDPKAWNQAANAGYGGVVSSSFISTDADCFDPNTAKLIPPVDVAKAQSILENDGYTLSNGKLTRDGKPLTLSLLGSPDLEQSGPEYIFEQLTKLGANVNFTNVDRATFVNDLFHGNFDIVPSGNSSAMPDPGYAAPYYSGAPSPAGRNYGHIVDPAIDAAVKVALGATGPDRCKDWNKVQEMLLQKHWILPLAAPRYYWFGNKTDFVVIFQLIEPYSLHRTA